jgi:hypothetical protein
VKPQTQPDDTCAKIGRELLWGLVFEVDEISFLKPEFAFGFVPPSPNNSVASVGSVALLIAVHNGLSSSRTEFSPPHPN